MLRPSHVKTNALKKQGSVESFNVSPKGSYEGLLLKSEGEMIQINFPREWGGAVAEVAPVGGKIEAKVEPEDEHEDTSHPVFRLVSLQAGKKKTLTLLNGEGGDFSGKVKRLNYALHGAVNGAILDSGDFLHVKPHGAELLGLEVGMKVEGRGPTKPMVGGFQVIEAEEVNGISMEKKPKPKKKAGEKPAKRA